MPAKYFSTRFLLACSVLLVWSFLADGQAPVTGTLAWREFRSEAGGFSVKFPGIPTVRDLPFQKGPVQVVRHSHVFVAGNLEFDVEYVEFPKGYSDPTVTLEGGISGLRRTIESKGGTLLTDVKVARGTCAGREATFALGPTANGKSGFSHGRAFSSGERLYFVLFSSKDDGPEIRSTALSFMDSFSVTGGCTTVIAPTTAPSLPKNVEKLEGTPDRDTGWRKIENQKLGFSMLMPGHVTHETEQSQVDPFPITHHTYSFETDNTFYSLEVFGDYPPNFNTTPVHHQTAIDITLYSLKKNLEPAGFVITPLRDLKLANLLGREFSILHSKLSMRGRAQIYSTPKHVYVLCAIAIDRPESDQSLDRFLLSVRLSPE